MKTIEMVQDDKGTNYTGLEHYYTDTRGLVFRFVYQLDPSA